MAVVTQAPAVTASSKVELHLKCLNLPDMDVMSKSDPQIRVYLSDTRTGNREKLIGQTEIIWDNLNPQFSTPICLDYYFEEVQNLRFECVDIDKHGFDMIGSMRCTLGEIIGGRGSELARVFTQPRKSFEKNKHGKAPVCIVRADEISGSKDAKITFSFYASKVDKKDFLGKSDPLLEIHRVNPDGQTTLVHRTEHLIQTLDPQWQPFVINRSTLCSGDETRPLILRVWDWNKSGNYSYIGECRLSLEILRKERQWPLINSEKQKKKKKYTDSGILHLQSIKIVEKHSFMEYILGGLQINLVLGIDFTGSNGNPANPTSLHYRGPNGNQYTRAIVAISQILLAYDSDGLVPTYGFGGRLPNGQTSHCFALSGDPARPELAGVQGIMGAYNNAFTWVGLHGPTNFAPIINTVAKSAREIDDNIADFPAYMILLIITDGEITDMANTSDAIVAAATLPLSIIIVGVGNADFGKMDVLDGDDNRLRDSRGRYAARDIVQFVPYNRFANNPASLAAEVLMEVPEQVTSYFESRHIAPKIRQAPSSHDLAKLIARQDSEIVEIAQGSTTVVQQTTTVSQAPMQQQSVQMQQQPVQMQQQQPMQMQQQPMQMQQQTGQAQQGQMQQGNAGYQAGFEAALAQLGLDPATYQQQRMSGQMDPQQNRMSGQMPQQQQYAPQQGYGQPQQGAYGQPQQHQQQQSYQQAPQQQYQAGGGVMQGYQNYGQQQQQQRYPPGA